MGKNISDIVNRLPVLKSEKEVWNTLERFCKDNRQLCSQVNTLATDTVFGALFQWTIGLVLINNLTAYLYLGKSFEKIRLT